VTKKTFQYDKTYTTQEGRSVGELGSGTRLRDRWFSRRHPKVAKKPDFPKSRVSQIGASTSQPFPAWSVWYPGEDFPEHPANRSSQRSSAQPKK